MIYRYFDGTLYAFVAKTLYRIPTDHPFRSDLGPGFFASYLPLYPLLIRALTLVTGGAYGPAMLLATLLTSTAAAVLFHRVLRAFGLVASPLWTAVLFCLLPPRWLIYHSVGATEPLFYCFLFGALLSDAKRKPWGVILCVVGASWTRITGVLLVPAFALIYAERRAWRDLAVLPLAGVGTLGLFAFHAMRFGDFFAYLRWQGGAGHLLDAVPLAAYRELAASPSFQQVMQRVQRELTKEYFLHENQKVLITFSAGVAEMRAGENRDGLIARADAAMYKAKASGRNRVALAE